MRNTTADAGRVGTVVEIMCHGHIVKAKILGIKQTYAGSPAGDPAQYEYDCEFIEHLRSGATRICLDFGQDWYISAGETFMAGETQIAAAGKWIASEANAAPIGWDHGPAERAVAQALNGEQDDG